MKKAAQYLFWSAMIVGLIIRIFTISYNGVFDMATYNEWGMAAVSKGLNGAYNGTYFPFQYQIFEFNSWLATILDVDYYIVYKAVNLVFDCGNAFLLYLILRKTGASVFYVLLYWLHPWFINVFSLGYIDFQFTFFILATLLFTIKDNARDYLKAGIFLGFAFLMKPQVQIVFLSFFIYAAVLYLKKREMKALNMFVFPVILFVNYNIYFLVGGHHPLMLAHTYLDVANNMACLNANCLNAWFPVAYFLKANGEPIYSVSDRLSVAGIVSFRLIATMSVLFLVFLFIRRSVNQKNEASENYSFYLIACFASLIVPFLMTSAHENHLFLASVLVIPVLGKSKNILLHVAVQIVLLLCFLNLYGFYGAGEISKIKLPRYNYQYETTLIFSLITIIAFLILLYHFLSRKSKLFLLLANK
jgi:hypothetical protein